MSAESNLNLARAAYAARVREDWDGFFSIFDTAAVLQLPRSLPIGGSFEGLEAVRRGVQSMHSMWDFAGVVLERITAGDEIVIAYLHMNVFCANTAMSYGFPMVELSRLRGRRVIEFTPFYFDTHRVNRVLGTRREGTSR